MNIFSSGGYRGIRAATRTYVGHEAAGLLSISGTSGARYRSNGQTYVGYGVGGEGFVDIRGGDFFDVTITIGSAGGAGRVRLDGGLFTSTSGGLAVGLSGGSGAIELVAGDFACRKLTLSGADGGGSAIAFLDAAVGAVVNGNTTSTVGNPFRNGIGFGSGATSKVKVTAVAGAAIRFTGNADADVEFRTSGAAACADMTGLNNLTFVCRKNNILVGDSREPDEHKYSQLEIGGVDLGARMTGFCGELRPRWPGAADA